MYKVTQHWNDLVQTHSASEGSFKSNERITLQLVIRTRTWQILDKSLRSCIRLRFLKKRSDMLSFKTRRSQGEKHLGLFKLLMSYLTRAKIFPKIRTRSSITQKGRRQSSVKILDGWNDSSPTLRVRLMAGHRPPTTGERGFDNPYVTVAPCGFATITGGSRGTLSYANCTVDCTARCLTNLLLKAPFTTGMAERKKVAYGTFCSTVCLNILTNKSVLHLVRLGSSGLKVL